MFPVHDPEVNWHTRRRADVLQLKSDSSIYVGQNLKVFVHVDDLHQEPVDALLRSDEEKWEWCQLLNEADHALFRHMVEKLHYVLPERFDLTFPMWLLSKQKQYSDFGGDKESRRSVSSCVITMMGNSILMNARQQTLVETSSCEAERYTLALGLAEVLGVRSLLDELDSSACRAVTTRTELGRCRHLDIKLLWIQEVSARIYVAIRTIRSRENPTDLDTKFLEKIKMIELRAAVRIYKLMNDAEVNMITEGDSEEGSYFIDMMLIILAYIGLYAIGYWSWQQWRRRQLQPAVQMTYTGATALECGRTASRS